MRKAVLTIFFTGLLLLGRNSVQSVNAQVPVVQVVKAVATKVIKAMDLAVQRLQNEAIRLQYIQKRIENAMSKLRLQEIADWGEKQREIFKTYYDELWKVKSIIAYYQNIKSTVQKQVQLVQEYKDAYALLQKDKSFRSDELTYMLEVYTGILEESAKNIDQLAIVINSFSTQMSDAKRLEMIYAIGVRIDQQLNQLRKFTNQNMMISVERARDDQERSIIKQYYGIE